MQQCVEESAPLRIGAEEHKTPPAEARVQRGDEVEETGREGCTEDACSTREIETRVASQQG